MKTIEVIVALNGETRIETKGFSGDSCREASHWIESALGLRLAESRTAEYHLATTQNPLIQGNGT